jgi:hypothetical protein
MINNVLYKIYIVLIKPDNFLMLLLIGAVNIKKEYSIGVEYEYLEVFENGYDRVS